MAIAVGHNLEFGYIQHMVKYVYIILKVEL